MTNYLSYIPLSYKLALVKTVIHTIFSTCNSWKTFHFDVKELKYLLQKYLFPPKKMDHEIKKYLDKRQKITIQNLLTFASQCIMNRV